MFNEPAAMYIIGVVVGATIPISIGRLRSNRHQELTESLLVQSIGQHAYLRAAKEIVDDETDQRIQKRGTELLEEYDLDAVDPQEVEHVE